jgi:hypothetical protein
LETVRGLLMDHKAECVRERIGTALFLTGLRGSH